MDIKKPFFGTYTLPNLIGYATIVSVAVLGYQLLKPGQERAIGIVLLCMFALLFAFAPSDQKKPGWAKRLYFVLQSIAVCILLLMHPAWSIFPILFFILSAQATMVFDEPHGYVWVGLFSFLTVIIFLILGKTLEDYLSSLPFLAGYWFFAAFSRSLIMVDQARKESQHLLSELQTAHHQLQEYAAQVEELAVSEERNRLAREMHDTIGHRLTVSAVQLEGAQRLIPTDPNRAAEIVGTVREQVREALSELRRTVATLREPLQTDIPLPIALSRLVDAFQQATGLQVALEISSADWELPNVHRLTLYRVVQEGLTNIQRHARANHIWITLHKDAGRIVLNIEDDGIGLQDGLHETGFGLLGLRERMAQIQGEMILESSRHGGLQLNVMIPFPSEQPHE